jgi:hypothetical protein
MSAMVGIWIAFALILFLIEPLSRKRLVPSAPSRSRLALLRRGHIVLLALAALTTLGAVAGSHGYSLL